MRQLSAISSNGLSMLVVLLGLVLAASAPTSAIAAEDGAALAMVRPDHHAIIKVDVGAILSSKLVEGLPANPEEIVKNLNLRRPDADMAKTLLNLDLLCVSIGPRNQQAADGGPPVGLGIYARFKSPEALQEFLDKVNEEKGEAVKYNGKEYFKSKRPGGPVMLISGAEIYVATDEDTIKQVIDNKGTPSDTPLVKKLAGINFAAPIVVAGSLGHLKEMAAGAAQEAAKGSPLEDAAQLPGQFEWGVIAVDLDGKKLIDIDADLDNEQGAEKLKTSLEGFLKMAQEQVAQVPPSVKQSKLGDAVAMAKSLLDAITIERSGKHVDVTLNRTPDFDKLPEILGKAVQEAREAAKSAMSLNTARQLYMGLMMDEAQKGKKTGNIVDDAGKPLLSWRVKILPYIDENQMFSTVQLKEAWDSEQNKKFADKMPTIFKTDSATEPNTTTWRKLPENSARIVLIDAGKGAAVPWMQPDELKIDPQNPLAALGEAPPKGYAAAFEDGHVERVTPERFKAVFEKK